MTPEQDRSGAHADRPFRPTRAQRIVAAGFLGAFGLTILTVLLTGLAVRSSHPRAASPPPVPAAAERVEAAPEVPEPAARTDANGDANGAERRAETDAADETSEQQRGSASGGRGPDGVR